MSACECEVRAVLLKLPCLLCCAQKLLVWGMREVLLKLLARDAVLFNCLPEMQCYSNCLQWMECYSNCLHWMQSYSNCLLLSFTPCCAQKLKEISGTSAVLFKLLLPSLLHAETLQVLCHMCSAPQTASVACSVLGAPIAAETTACSCSDISTA